MYALVNLYMSILGALWMSMWEVARGTVCCGMRTLGGLVGVSDQPLNISTGIIEIQST